MSPARRPLLAALPAAAALTLGPASPAGAAPPAPSPVSITRVSVSAAGLPGDANSTGPSVSADGRYVAFSSFADNLTPAGAQPGDLNVYLRDTVAHTTSLVSATPTGSPGDYLSYAPSISADGRYVAYSSYADDLVPGTPKAQWAHIFVWDRSTGKTTLVDRSTAGRVAGLESGQPEISADGHDVTFYSRASNLVPGGTPFDTEQVYLRDLRSGTTKLLTVGPDGKPGGSYSIGPQITGNGRYVTVQSTASLTTVDTQNEDNIYRIDTVTGKIVLVSANRAGMPSADGGARYEDISDDGRYVVFVENAPDLAPGTTSGATIFVKDLATGGLRVLAPRKDERVYSDQPTISGNGRFVAYMVDRVRASGREVEEVWVRDLRTGVRRLASVRTMQHAANGVSDYAALGYGGQTVTFDSFATDLVKPQKAASNKIDIYQARFLEPWAG